MCFVSKANGFSFPAFDKYSDAKTSGFKGNERDCLNRNREKSNGSLSFL